MKAVSEIESFCLATVAKINPHDFIPIKKTVLYDALRAKRFNDLQQLYPELKDAMIKGGTPYKIVAPVSSCIALALKGFPILANKLYHFNMWLIESVRQIKSWVNKE